MSTKPITPAPSRALHDNERCQSEPPPAPGRFHRLTFVLEVPYA